MLKPLIIAAPASGSGKTTLTLGLLAALKRRGISVAPFKVGPDFIDPGHHAAACGRVSRNLDGWMCGEKEVRTIFARGCSGAELAVVEGVMGLFDGASGDSDEGSTAEIARWLSGRILLVVDARSQARSAAALVKGFVDFDARLEFAGVVFNRVGSARHEELLRQAVASTPGLPPVLGCLPRESGIELPERHLGLVTAADGAVDYQALADLVEAHLDIDALFENLHRRENDSAARTPGRQEGSLPDTGPSPQAKVCIGVARDTAFCFCYPENLERLEAAGARLVFFSPLTDSLPEQIDGLYLPGGYPELHIGQLAANRVLLEDVRERVEAGLPVYAECGGLLLLCAGLEGHRLSGVFPAEARMLARRKALGYREVTMTAGTPLGPAGTKARGHEFHYSELDMPPGIERAYRLARKGGADLGVEGFRYKNVLASYVHLHFGSNPRLAENFVSFCEKAKGNHEGTKSTKI
ncbi:MAG: cobyrinate a,c-diamide synthase [Geothermobacteraceae bacterium]